MPFRQLSLITESKLMYSRAIKIMNSTPQKYISNKNSLRDLRDFFSLEVDNTWNKCTLANNNTNLLPICTWCTKQQADGF